MAVSASDFVRFFGSLFKSLITLGDTDSYKRAASGSKATQAARARNRAALAARPPDQGAGGGFEARAGGGAGDKIIPPRPPRTPPSSAPQQPPPYEDGIDVRVRSSWIAAFNFRPFRGQVRQYTGSRFPTTLPDNKGDMTMVIINPSYRNPEGRYVYPHVPRIIMDRAVAVGSPGKFYWSVLRYYSNRSLIGRRMRSRGRMLRR